MPILKVSKTLRGELYLPMISDKLKANSQFNVSDDVFFSDHIQAALKKGFIQVEGEIPVKPFSAMKIRIKNISKNPLAISDLNINLSPGEITYRNSADIHNRQLQTSIAKGIIEVRNDGEIKGEIKKEKPQEIVEKSLKPKKNKQPESQDKTSPQSWDAYSGKMLDITDSKTETLKQLNSIPEDNVMTIKTGTASQGTSLVVTSKSKTKKQKKEKPEKKTKTINPVGKRRASPSGNDVIMDLPNESGDLNVLDLESKEEINFVDKEQEVNRIKNRFRSNNDEIS